MKTLILGLSALIFISETQTMSTSFSQHSAEAGKFLDLAAKEPRGAEENLKVHNALCDRYLQRQLKRLFMNFPNNEITRYERALVIDVLEQELRTTDFKVVEENLLPFVEDLLIGVPMTWLSQEKGSGSQLQDFTRLARLLALTDPKGFARLTQGHLNVLRQVQLLKVTSDEHIKFVSDSGL